jgi:polyisoprenoid-binding protein YceI
LFLIIRSRGTITASLDAATVDTGIGLRNKHLRKEEYFHVEKLPHITMRSTRIEKKDTNTYDGYFDLTIKGTTKNIKMPFTFVRNGNVGEFNGELQLNRLDYQLGNGE